MRTSPRGVAFIAAHEGIVTRAYRDAGGRWTIGVGHTAAAGAPQPVRGMTITREHALRILAADLPRYEPRVAAALGHAAQHEFDGAVSFDFNTGAIDRASWVARFRDGDLPAARAGLLEWTKAGGRTMTGLLRRRQDEARLIFDGDYGSIPPLEYLADAPAASSSADELAEVQRALARLGFDPGAIDGIAGDRTRAAVRAYQATHPDLAVDGIAGPATRAALARDLALRDGQKQTSAAAIVALMLAAFAWLAAGPHLALALAAMAALAGAAGAAILAWRYRGEFARLIGRAPRRL